MNSLLYLSTFIAQVEPATTSWDLGVDHLLRALLAVCVFSLVGVAVLAVSFWTICKMSPFSVRKEIEEDQNVALGIIMGAIIIGISIIIAASVAS
jgi:putative membrane protein